MLTLKIDAINHVCHSAVFRWSELRWIAFPSVFVRFCWGLTTSNRFEGIPVRFFTTCRPDLLAIFSAWLITAKALLARLRFRPVQTVALEVFFSLAALLFCWGGAPSFRWSPAARIVLRHLWPDLLLQRFCCRSFCAFESADFAVRSLIFFCCDFTTGFHRFHWIVIRSQRFYSFSLTPETRIPL